jgi:valyl-tRNA synthetase
MYNIYYIHDWYANCHEFIITQCTHESKQCIEPHTHVQYYVSIKNIHKYAKSQFTRSNILPVQMEKSQLSLIPLLSHI